MRGYLQYWDINDFDRNIPRKDKNIISHKFKSHDMTDLSRKGL